MNNKTKTITRIQNAVDSHTLWLDQAKLLVEGKSTHTVRKPIACTECEFGVWFYSEGQLLNSFPWFKEVDALHKEFHEAYRTLFERADEVYDEKTLDKLKGCFSSLEVQSGLLVDKLEKIKTVLEEISDEVFEEKSNATAINSEEVIEEPSVEEAHYEELSSGDKLSPSIMSFQMDSKQLEMHKQLKEFDLVQLQQEQELTEQELKQLDTRQTLTNQGVEQVSQYQQLKQEEITQQLSDHQELENSNNQDKELRQKELAQIKKEIGSKQDELEQLKLVDQKLESRKLEEKKKEQSILDNFERKQYSDKQDLIELGHQREKWETEATKLRQQLLLVEQDIEDVTKQQEAKQLLIDNSDEDKELKLQELAEGSKQQALLDGHKHKVKEAKLEELEYLEKEMSEKQQDLSQLESDAAMLRAQKTELSKKHKQELKQLDEQQRFKKLSMEKIEQDKRRKQQELKELVHQQDAIKKNLEELSQQQSKNNDAEKELEEV